LLLERSKTRSFLSFHWLGWKNPGVPVDFPLNQSIVSANGGFQSVVPKKIIEANDFSDFSIQNISKP